MIRRFTRMLRRHSHARRVDVRFHPRFESLEKRELMAADFLEASVVDASRDVTSQTVFQDGALRVAYDLQFSGRDRVESIGILAQLGKRSVEIESPGSQKLIPLDGLPTQASDVLFDLNDDAELIAGDYQLQVVARMSSGDVVYSDPVAMRVLDTLQFDGSFQGEWFDMGGELTEQPRGIVVHGQGGTDALKLGRALSQVDLFNGRTLSRFDPLEIDHLPIHQGYAVDHLVLENGSEIYFTGIERITGELPREKSASSLDKKMMDDFSIGWGLPGTLSLAVEPNDPDFPEQWNLHVSDVPGAWRFTTGAEDVLLVSLDSGLLPAGEPEHVHGRIADLSEERLITDATDTEDQHFTSRKYGHGHMAISVMSSTPNNDEFVAGINWTSDVFVTDLYGASNGGDSVNLQTAIEQALDHAEQNNQKVVFQGGIQGESWLTSGGTQQQLEALFSATEDRALFAVAAGNGGVEVERRTNETNLTGGVARLQTTHPNVMAIGAMQREATTSFGMANAQDVFKASYSNYGDALTLMGATDSPATYLFSDIDEPQFHQETGSQSFGGTSAANPNVAGIASLVWSAHIGLSGTQVRQILTDTAMKNLPNGDGMNLLTGKDDYYGHGLVNAELAVRRAAAMATDQRLVNIHYDPRAELTELETHLNTETIHHRETLASTAFAEPLTAPSVDSADDAFTDDAGRNGATDFRADRFRPLSRQVVLSTGKPAAAQQRLNSNRSESHATDRHHQTVDRVFGFFAEDDLLDATPVALALVAFG